jgi:hypothetical protein
MDAAQPNVAGAQKSKTYWIKAASLLILLLYMKQMPTTTNYSWQCNGYS